MAVSQISITQGMRANLVSLQSTEKLFNQTQNRLSTGKKVNTALDNPASYFTSRSLSAKASDLSGLMDSIGQAVSTLEVADKGLTTLTKFVEQGKSLANSAYDTTNVKSFKNGTLLVDPATAKTQKLTDVAVGLEDQDFFTVRLGNATQMVGDKNLNPTRTLQDLKLTDDYGLEVIVGNETYTFETLATMTDAGINISNDGKKVTLGQDVTIEKFLETIVDVVGRKKISAQITDGFLTIKTLDASSLVVRPRPDLIQGYNVGNDVTIGVNNTRLGIAFDNINATINTALGAGGSLTVFENSLTASTVWGGGQLASYATAKTFVLNTITAFQSTGEFATANTLQQEINAIDALVVRAQDNAGLAGAVANSTGAVNAINTGATNTSVTDASTRLTASDVFADDLQMASTDLIARLNAINALTAGTFPDFSALATALADTNTLYDATKTQLGNLSNSLANVATNKNNATGFLTTATNNLGVDVGIVATNTTNAKSQVDNAKGNLNTAVGSLTTAQTDVTNAKTSVASALADMGTLLGQIDTLIAIGTHPQLTDITALRGALVGYQSDATSVQTTLNTVGGTLVTANTQITTVVGNVDTAVTRAMTAQTKANDVSNALTGLKSTGTTAVDHGATKLSDVVTNAIVPQLRIDNLKTNSLRLWDGVGAEIVFKIDERTTVEELADRINVALGRVYIATSSAGGGLSLRHADGTHITAVSGALTQATANSPLVMEKNAIGFANAVGDVNATSTYFNDAFGLDSGTMVSINENMTVEDFRKELSGIDGITADFDANGRLVVFGDQGADFIIKDSRGVAALMMGIEGATTNGNEARATYAKQFDQLITQIDQLVTDTSYKGINLLNGEDLTVIFNENRTSSLEIKSVVFDSKGIGLTYAQNNWKDQADIAKTLTQIEKATSVLRAQASEFGQNLATVQAREDFTDQFINQLTVGSDKLVLAEMNEEASNMLSLQTRQQLATNSLSLSSKASQSVLSLF